MGNPELLRFVILLGIFVSIFLLAQVGLRYGVEGRAHHGAINRRLKLIARGRDRAEIIGVLRKNDPGDPTQFNFLSGHVAKLRRNLLMAGIPVTLVQTMAAMAGLFALSVLSLVVLAGSLGFVLTLGVAQLVVVLAAALAVVLPSFALRIMAERRRKRMQDQFPVALDIFVRALRSGHPVTAALELLTQEMGDPIGSEFGLVSDEVAYGADLIEALEGLAERWDLDDIRMFVTSLSVQKETGGNLAEVLDNLSRVIRERAALYLKVRALSSEGRMTGWVLTIAPIVTFLLLFSMNPGFYLDVATDPIFFIGFPLLLGWYVVGVIIIRRMIDLKV